MEEVFLTPCPQCSRHILSDEERCPFCTAHVRARLKSAKAPAPIPARRMGRASAFLFRATALAGLTTATTSACAVEEEPAAQRGEVQPTPDAADRTSHVILGRAGNNPYCHHRALEMNRLGKRERLVPVDSAPGAPFDHGRFRVVVEDV